MNASTPVVGLLRRGGPAAVARFVVAGIVDAIYRQADRRAMPNIRKEGAKVIGPAVTDFYSSATIAVKAWILRISTAIFHIQPHTVFRRATRLAVSKPGFRCSRPLHASATFSVPSPEVVGVRNGGPAAIALAMPHSFSRSGILCSLDYKQALKALSGNVYEAGHVGGVA